MVQIGDLVLLHFILDVFLFGDACDVKVIIVRNGHGNPSSNLGWDRLHFTVLIPLGKVWIQLFSLSHPQRWENSGAEWALQPWYGLEERKLWIQNQLNSI